MTKKLLGSLELNRIYQRDCLEGMRLIPDKSVELIIADPPYYKIKGDFDFKWRTMREYLDWCTEWLKECERVLSPRGSFYIYGMDLQLEYIATIIDEKTQFEYRNRITLNKPSYIKELYGSQEHFRKFIPVAEFLLFYTFQDETGLKAINSTLYQDIRDYMRKPVIENGYSYRDIDVYLRQKSLLGNASKMAQQFFGDNSQLKVSVKAKWEALQELLGYEKTWEEMGQWEKELKEKFESLRREYENQRYTFNAKDGMTNVWDFEADRGKLKTKHPTQKPMALCERIVSVSSNEGETVLIPFVGSGSECVAATKLNRNFIGFELESEYVRIANQRLEAIRDGIAERKLAE